MLFNTPLYLVFLIVVFTVFYFLPKRIDKFFLLGASYIFYGYWDWRFLLLLVGSSLMDYYFGLLIYRAQAQKTKKTILLLSLLINLAILCFFKYFNFFIDSFQLAFGHKLDFLHIHILLPVGISFYTFQSLSYTFDIYRDKLTPTKDTLDYCLFVGVFPHMVSGPIVKAKVILPQLATLQKPVKKDFLTGFSLITVGMFQKVLIGDTVAKFVNHIFADPTYYSSSELLFSLLMFTIQIYADFSGYSNIARGSAKLFGIDLIDNFNQPYLAANITDFWRRWHISLSDWLKDYVYIWWLGGNRISKVRTYINLMLTMLIGGFWHGANWTFIVWGGLHGLGLAVHKWFMERTKNVNITSKPLHFFLNALSSVSTFLFVVLAWLFFRAPDFKTARFYLDRMFINRVSSTLTLDLFIIFIMYFSVILFMDLVERKMKCHEYLGQLKPALRYGIAIPIWIAVILYMYTVGIPAPFIYFQF